MQTEAAMETSSTTLEESAKAVKIIPTPTSIFICSTTVSSPMPPPMSIYSMVVIATQVHPSLKPTLTNCNAILSNPASLSYAFGPGPHLSSTAESGALGQLTMSAQSSISSRNLAPSPSFNIHLDPAEMDFLKKKLSDSQERQKNVFLEAGRLIPNVAIVADLERPLHDGSSMALSKPLQK